jgi:rubredoxin
MEALRKLVWIEHDRFQGWGCSECAWVFRPSDALTGKSLAEMTHIFESQRDKEFASHVCATHPRAKIKKR